MIDVTIREPKIEDREKFIFAMQGSQSLHHPWVKSPLTPQEFDEYFQRSQQPNQKSFLVCHSNNIVGVFNVSEIVCGLFQNAYLGFYAVADYVGKGYMSAGLKLVLKKVFEEIGLHRLEANIQPENIRSIQLVKKNGFRCEGFSPRYLKINNEWRGHEHWTMTLEDFIKDNKDVLAKDHVELVPYNSLWLSEANIEIEKLKNVIPLNCIVDIQHVGSTAIPGLSAKPIIDIQIAANSLDEMKVIAIPALQKMGYEYWYDNPDTERMFFVKGMPPFGERRTHHVHIVEPTSKHWFGKIAFRDYLISHPKAAKEYEQLKIELAQQHTFDREEYTNAKTKFVNDILQKSSVCMTVNNTVETENLLLRRPTFSDVLILRDLWQSEKVREFLGGIVSSEIIDEKLASLQKHWNQYGFGQWSVIHKGDNQVIGICGLHHSEDGIEFSYMFFSTSWGKGLATEAAVASLNYGFNVLNFDKIIAITQEANHPSCRLLEKMGMRRIDKFSRFDAIQCLYQLIRNEWGVKTK